MDAETDYQYLMRRLPELRGQYGVISRATGVPYFTLVKVARGEVTPRATTVDPLVRHLRTLDTSTSPS